MSRKHVAVIDPHRQCVKPESETSPAGTQKKLTSFFEYGGHASTFESLFGLDTREKEYKGTIFRFPLRQPRSNSQISEKVYTPEMIQRMLFDSLKEESAYILLFLRNVKSISLMEWRTNSSEARETFRVESISDASSDMVREQSQFAEQCSQGNERGSSEVCLELNSVTISVHNNPAISSPVEHHWIVLKVQGTNDVELGTLGEDLSVLPWVGLATRLPKHVALHNCKAATSLQFDDCNTLKDVFKQLEHQLWGAQLSIEWSSESATNTDGHAYCFLPLPECTAMPVHVHGYFAVTDNRRSIKWPAHDEKGKEARWNKKLLDKMVAPSYALLLACRTCLIHYEDTPLPLTNIDNVTDAYSAWPLRSEVKNVQIWKELVPPTLGFSSSLPLLWTSAGGGKWIQFSEAYYLPGSFSTSSHSCSPIVIKLLKRLGIPVVCLPKGICETIKESEHLMKIVQCREISPQFFRQRIKTDPHCCSSLSKEEVYDALGYVLSDINEHTCGDLVGVPLLPLKGALRAVAFQRPTSHNNKYIFSTKSKSLVNIIPGTDSLIVDTELPQEVTKKLCEIAEAKRLQLVEVSTQVMCKHLLPASIQSWCTKKKGPGWRWTPGRNSMPPQSWMSALWKWVGKCSVSLSMLQELPIVPLLSFDSSQHKEMTLVRPTKENLLCRLTVSFPSKDRTILTGVLEKLKFLIADESMMNNCDKMNKHPDIKEFIPRLVLGLELIVKHLDRMSIGSRLEAIRSLCDGERDFVRKQFCYKSDFCSSYKGCLKSIPIYRAAHNIACSPHYITLDNEAFLPPKSMSPLPAYPSNMLSPIASPEEGSLYKALSVNQLKISELCTHHLIPLALNHIQKNPKSWSVGDELVLWILKQQSLPQEVLDPLSQLEIVYTCNSTHRDPQKVIDPQDRALSMLFDAESDGDCIPNERYLQDRYCRQTLIKLGMRTWKSYQGSCTQMCALLLERMRRTRTFEPSKQLSRGEFVLLSLADPANHKLRENSSLYKTPFLKAESCPTSYPPCLKEKWYGQKDKLYSIEELYPPSSSTYELVGTVKPILSRDYNLGRHALSVRAVETLAFQRINERDVLNHLMNLESTVVSAKDTEKFSRIVMSVYDYLHVNPPGRKLQSVWWRDSETPQFLLANKVVLKLPDNLQANLEPFYFLLRKPVRDYAQIFELRKSLTPAEVASLLKGIAKQASKRLTSLQIDTCISVLNWLCEKGYKEPGVLMLSEECTLVPAGDCVFDDKDWMKDSRSKRQIKAKSLLFVHDRVPQKVAKHFHVVPLSRKVAPSQKLGISYTKAGQHEDITHRIRHIVQEYETNIDIFKELIQNADDAGATEVKFLIDWRHHPTESLIADELKEWQGPALIAYNNATFSDEDLENICKVAGETKKNDPLKTGRFGVGFCATYRLTDLPSFISRKFFTMFDPHTSYLGDRVSAQEPGIRVNLVENQADLKLYHDQFKPYEDLFGCRVFNLTDDGYPGTLFRFPFRSLQTSRNSKICETIYNKPKISTLVKSLKDQGSELPLFLKHINKVSLYELENDHDPSATLETFSIQRTGDSSKRIELITKWGVLKSEEEKSCSSKFDIEVRDGTKKHSHTTWILSSAIECPTDKQLMNCPEAEGLLPLAEVALEVNSSTDDGIILLNHDSDSSKVFCFLPLPIRSRLPFHVNGFFSIGKDRRNISATDDQSFGSLWNKSLARGALVKAFINLLYTLCKDCDLQKVSDTKVKQQYLRYYYSLWNMSGATGLISETLVSEFKKTVPELTCPLIWSEVDGGCWLPPTKVAVFRDEKLDEYNKIDIKHDATSLLLSHRHGLANLPYHIHNILGSALKNTGRLFNYQRFCEEIFFPEIDTMDPEIRNRSIKFLVEQFGTYSGRNNWYKWAKEFLSERPCISCQNSDILRPGSQLIDPRNEFFKKLFDVCEGRFPSEQLQTSTRAMDGLCALGMTSSKLNIDDLLSRAKQVALLDYDNALQRSVHLCAYIEHKYGSPYFATQRNKLEMHELQELQELSTIPFLPVKQKPDGINVPWCGRAKMFETPLQVYSPSYMYLVFSQFPVVDVTSREVLRCLGISSKQPTLDTIISHLKHVSGYMTSKADDATSKFLDEAMKAVYTSLEKDYSKPEEIEWLMQVKNIIWQDGYFLSPNQVVRHWMHSCVPYLCELSTANKMNLMEKLGVKNEPTLKMLECILQQVAEEYGSRALPEDVLHFVEFTARRLEIKVIYLQPNERYALRVFLPDEKSIMREVSHLAENVSDVSTTKWVTNLPVYDEFMRSGDCYFVHKSISRHTAIALGVKPLLEAVLHEIEDLDFLSGSEFGQHEDLCDRLNGILRKYPADVSILQEFIQNADDAQATEIVFVLDHRTDFPDNTLLSSNSKWKSLQHTPALCIFNNRKFTHADIEGIAKLGRGGKDRSPKLIGKFGIGFNVAYHVTDCPSFVSYSEDGTPEYLCVFDPTQSFVSDPKKRSHGKKWNFKSQDHHSGFLDQFQPYLMKDLPKLSENAPKCLQNQENGFVVFRLPLTRLSKGEKPSQTSLDSGHDFSLAELNHIFRKFALISQDMLLFLNHLKNVSAFEIFEGGKCIHHFSTYASVPDYCLPSFEQYSSSLKQCVQTIEDGSRAECVSLSHQMTITHIETQPTKQYSSKQKSQWLVQRIVGGSGLNSDVLKAGLRHGLLPVGGVATLLKTTLRDNHEYHLFCFLPLPIQSNLPVHVNGHFLVDDSRKHLETMTHEGLGNWNQLLAQYVIVPAYIDLIMTAKELVNSRSDCRWFYSLFPRPAKQRTELEVSKSGELDNLKIVHNFYMKLLQINPAVIVPKVPDLSKALTWMTVRSCLFFVDFLCEETQICLRFDDNVCKVLVSLKLPLANVPNFIYRGCLEADASQSFTTSARVDPNKIIAHLRNLNCSEEQKKVIKENIQSLLTYCIAGYSPKNVPDLFSDALYLVASDGTLQRGTLFQSSFLKLLPRCPQKFIDPELEKSDIGKKLQGSEFQVICPLTLDFVATHIDLPHTNSSCTLDDSNSRTVKLLWECITVQCSRGMCNAKVVKNFFHFIAIIPTSNNKLYPVRLSNSLVRDSVNNCDQCSVMKKLGYSQIDFNKIGFPVRSTNVRNNIINNLTTCFQDGKSIINCLQLQEPQNLNIHLSDEEAQSFTSLLGKVSSGQLQQVSSYLLKLPLFSTIDGSRVSLHGVTKVFILASTDIPLHGIPSTYNGQVVLGAATTKAMQNFYGSVIPQAITSHVSPEQFYVQLVCPILSDLEVKNIKKHLNYVYLHRDNEMKAAFQKLKETPFIKHNGQLCKVSDLRDHRVKLFTTFHQGTVLPAVWQDENTIVLLESLGLHIKVTTTEWFECARDFAEGFSVDNIPYKSKVLLDKLIDIIQDHLSDLSSLVIFFEAVANIEFIYCPQGWQLNGILHRIFPDQRNSRSITHSMVKMRGSVSFQEANLACLCKSVLPESCQPLVTNSNVRNRLHIEAPVSSKTVAENLKCLCTCLNVTCARELSSVNSELVTKLVDIFGMHYACLSLKKPSPDILNDFKDMMCILLPSKPLLLQLVKPSQLVMHLPSGCSLEPYCYRAEPSLQKYVEFLTAIGVRQELKAQDYINILTSVQELLEDDSSVDNGEKEVIKCAYFEAVRCLRQGDTVTGDVDSIWLPDQSMKLVKVHNLCLNDAPWYEDRLPPDCGLKMILPPPTDDKGHFTLPKDLRVKQLSEVITEELVESCKSPDFVCNLEELFALGKRSESGRCLFVRKILDTLKSNELFHGLCGMYYTEHHVPPSESFMLSIQKLKRVQVHCIKKIKTVLHVNGQADLRTEDSSKLCFVCKESTSFALYIAPHNDALEEDLLSDLAFCIRKLIDSEVHDLVPIAAAFGCEPSGIPQALNRHNISQYTPSDNKQFKAITVGTPVSWNKLTHRDSLIVLNFDLEDPVRYVCDDGSLINAEIVSCKPTDDSTIVGFLEPTLTIRVKVDDRESEDTTDQRESSDGGSTDDDSNVHTDNSDDSDSNISESDAQGVCEDEPGVSNHADFKVVSPMQVFKILTTHQRKSLWGEGTSPFACPVILASVPFKDFTSLEQWLHYVFDSQFISSYSELTLKVLTLRLLGHIYYLFVIQEKAPSLFNRAALKIYDIIVQKELACDTVEHERKQMQKVMKLLTDMMESLTLEDVSDEEDSDADSELAVFKSSHNLFPSRDLARVMDMNSDDSDEDDRNTTHHSQASPPAQSNAAVTPGLVQGTPAVQSMNQPPAQSTAGASPSLVQGVQSMNQPPAQSTAGASPSLVQGVQSMNQPPAQSSAGASPSLVQGVQSMNQPPAQSTAGASPSLVQGVQPTQSSAGASPSQVQGAPTVHSVNQPSANILSRFSLGTRAQRRRQNQASRFQPVMYSAPRVSVTPQPKTCMKSATAWLEQAKADFKAAGCLLRSQATNTSSDAAEASASVEEVQFPALVCFLCHDTVEKCVKGVLYAFCGLKQNLVNCGNLVTLLDSLDSSSHCPRPLFDTIKDCVMSVNRHENRSRFPNYQNPPCAPASIYDTEDAQEAFSAAKKLLEQLKSEVKFYEVLGDLDQMPAKKFVSTLRSMPDNQGVKYVLCYIPLIVHGH